ncbi:MAG: DUF2254 domain-containing protein [Chitinophagaceae bacterium]
MIQKVLKWIKVACNRAVKNIAFLPALIALTFFVLSYFMIELDFSEKGKSIKLHLQWLRLKDASTARSIITVIVGGIISLTVFSFSMVMILLNQAASQMSNRVLDKLIGNRFQQFVLGFYIGTIVYALFLLSAIRDINSGIYVPAISTYLLILLTVIDIFLFIYFLHYITQSVKYETIIKKISDSTRALLKKSCTKQCIEPDMIPIGRDEKINAHKSGLYQGFDKDRLLRFCQAEDIVVSFIYPVGTFVLKDNPLFVVTATKDISADFEKKLRTVINIYRGHSPDTSYYYGFRQLTEIAMRALSPGINDPGTAIISLRSICDLLTHRLHYYPETSISDKNGNLRVVSNEKKFADLFSDTMLPIWQYGKKDRMIQQEMSHLLTQLKMQSDQPIINKLLTSVNMASKEIN